MLFLSVGMVTLRHVLEAWHTFLQQLPLLAPSPTISVCPFPFFFSTWIREATESRGQKLMRRVEGREKPQTIEKAGGNSVNEILRKGHTKEIEFTSL